jgi:O-antigen ligase
MLAFTALLFFRPQDQIPLIGALHLPELTAIGGLAAMTVRRIGAGKSITHVNAELVGILVLGAVLLLTMPFSIWPGGSMAVFTDIYVKVILIFVLMVNTITSPRRVRQMTWIMIAASGYLASRAVYDYLRGVNLTEGDRVRGAVGGMFENPNDLALNLVTFLAPTLFIIFLDKKPSRRLCAGAIAAAMMAAIVCTKSRSGFLGLVGMGAVVLYYLAKVKPALIAGVALAGLMALPVVPSSFWDRMDSIVNAEEDESGSRAARLRLIDQGIEVFLENPITGIGAGQFKNYNAPGVVEKWRVTHNLWLQLATELGVFGLLTFAFLVVRAYTSSFAALRMLRGPRRRGARAAPRGATPSPAARETTLDLSAEDRRILDINAKGMIAAMVGWTICPFFASVAFNWTFYYVLALAVAGREIVAARRRAAVAAPAAAPALMVRATA